MSTLYAYRGSPDLRKNYISTNRIIGCRIEEAAGWNDAQGEASAVCWVEMVRDDGTSFADSPEFGSRTAALTWLRAQCAVPPEELPVLNVAGGQTGE